MAKVDHIIEDLAPHESKDVTLVVQIQTPDAMIPEPSRGDHQLVPTNLLQSLKNAVDNRNTVDVKFICLEYGDEANLANQIGANDDSQGATSRSAAEVDLRIYRKRILYAHSDILRARSDYFKALLDFSASNTAPTDQGSTTDRHVETIHCNSADFQTLYWLLHYIYCNELELSSQEPLINVVKRMDIAIDSKARRLMGQDDTLPVANEWGWHFSSDEAAGGSTLSEIGNNKTGDDTGAQRSGSGMSVDGGEQSTQSLAQSWTGSSHLSFDRVSAVIAPLSPHASTAASRARSSAGTSEQASTLPGRSKSKPASRAAAGPIPADRSSFLSASVNSPAQSPTYTHHNMITPQTGSTDAPTATQTGDPDSHPVDRPAPASSFAIYVLAHQYTLTGLQEMAQAALLEDLTPTTACGLLLASYKYKDLYDEVKSYVVAHWVEIQQNVSLSTPVANLSTEYAHVRPLAKVAFLSAIQEVSNGM